MRLVLLGDLHFYQLGVWPWQLLSKRLLGQCNLWLNRRRHFRPELWPKLRDRIVDLAPDGILCSGDLTTTALRGEFRQARAALDELVDALPLPRGLHMVPGNHDRYTFSSKREHQFEKAFGEWTARAWPVSWPLGEEVEVIGLDPTRPNLFNASGALGKAQRDALRRTLAEVPTTSTVLVLCHYPIGTPPDQPEEAVGHGLEDAAALKEVLVEADRKLIYLHGHIHQPWVWGLQGSQVITVNAGAPMLTGSRFPEGQGLVELRLEGAAIHIVRHQLGGDGVWGTREESVE